LSDKQISRLYSLIDEQVRGSIPEVVPPLWP
jgi:hypothetical protein